VWIRLVKGAYWDAETIHARAAGWPVPVWQEKWRTDACFEVATRYLLEHSDVLRPALGSHNLRSLAHGMAVAEHLGLDRRTVEMQMLHGMGDPEKVAVVEAGWRLRVYMRAWRISCGGCSRTRRTIRSCARAS
jgi:RHH-type proline utilization regulon transcriptional repressor/proline dehydrogenase/delta 1-pyrroline-5-carboxylate dehydrogenase